MTDNAGSHRTDRPARAQRRLAARLRASLRPALVRGRGLLRGAVTTFAVLTLTLWLLPGVRAADVVDILWLVLLVAAVGALLRPLLVAGVRVLGGLAAMLLGASVQLIIIAVALRLDPAGHVTGLPTTVAAAGTAVVFAALLNWFADAGTDAAFVDELRRLMTRTRRTVARRALARTGASPGGAGRQPGLLIVQFDGLAAPVLDWAVRAGNLPTIGRWLRTGSHTATGWHTGLPASTPSAQAAILHGDTQRVPGYRWYDKDARRVMVAGRPRDAATVQRRLGDGEGLLRDGGVSIGNIFTGDAPTSLLTVSRAGLPGRSARGWAVFMASPYGLTRALVLGVAEMVAELHQARLQRRRDVFPRVSRLGPFLALRPAAMLLRDVNVSLVAEQMARGAPVIYCDLVDYDEVAHHAGPARPESLKALENLDRALGIMQRLALDAARDYHLVVLSDHGQSLGATFRHRYGETIDQVVTTLAGTGRAAGSAGSADAAGSAESADAAAPAPLVLSSGNLAMVYLPERPGKATREQIDADHPKLLDGLLAHPGIGLVVVDEAGTGPVALNRLGRHQLRDGTVDGPDPLTAYGARARADLLHHQRMEHVGDLVVLGAIDARTGDVAAFEELVGSHGGLGGWQTEAVLVHPADWPRDTDDLVGPLAVHHQLLSWLRRLGLREPEPTATAPVAPAQGGSATTESDPARRPPAEAAPTQPVGG